MNTPHDEPENIQLDLDEYEVTRPEFLAQTREPSFIFNDGKILLVQGISITLQLRRVLTVREV